MNEDKIIEDALATLTAENKTPETLRAEWGAERKQWRENNPHRTYDVMYEYPVKVIGEFEFKYYTIRSIDIVARRKGDNNPWVCIYELSDI